MLPETQRVALAQAEHRLRAQTKDVVVQRAKGSWLSLGSWRDGDVDRWVESTSAFVRAGQQQVAAGVNMRLAQSLEANQPFQMLDGLDTLRGVSLEDVYRRPMKQMRGMIAQGKSFDQALSASAARVEDLVKTDLQLAYTNQAQHVLKTAGPRYKVHGFRRTLVGSFNCGLCTIASTQRYNSADLLPIHPGCNCGVQEIGPGEWDEDAEFDRLQEAYGQLEEFGIPFTENPRELSKLLVTKAHGEYGPTLTWRSQKFTTATGREVDTAPKAVAPTTPVGQSMPYQLTPDLDAANPRGDFDRRTALGVDSGGFSSKEELYDYVAVEMRDAAQQPIKIEVPPQYLAGILSDGRFKSMFEVRPNDAHVSVRRGIEDDVFGLPAGVSDADRPIYGYMKADEDTAGYGPIKFVLDDAVKERTTMTGGDSIGAWLPGVPVKDAASASAERLAQSSHLTAGVGAKPDIRNWGYVEAQVHGGVDLFRDVKAIQMPRDLWGGKGWKALTPEDRDRVTKYGWKVILTDD